MISSSSFGVDPTSSCRQRSVQIVDDFVHVTAKQLMYFAKSAFLREGSVVEVRWIDAEIGCDVVPDHFQPAALLGCKPLADAFLLRQPRSEVGVDALGERDEFVVLMNGEA